jgi:hypothetical protein
VISGVHLSELLICADWCRVESRKCDVRESLVRNEGRAMADLTINKPTDANPYNVFSMAQYFLGIGCVGTVVSSDRGSNGCKEWNQAQPADN